MKSLRPPHFPLMSATLIIWAVKERSSARLLSVFSCYLIFVLRTCLSSGFSAVLHTPYAAQIENPQQPYPPHKRSTYTSNDLDASPPNTCSYDTTERNL